MILAAGRGERMGHLTANRPKPLLEVGGKALIVRLIEQLVAHDYRHLVINVAWCGEQIISALQNGAALGADIQYSDEGQDRLETAGGIIKALPLLGGAPFVVVNADLWTDYPFRNLRDVRTHAAHIVLVDNPVQHPNGDFSLHETIVGNAAHPRFTYSGIGVYHPAFFSAHRETRLSLGPLLREAAHAGELTGERYGGVWQDIGTPERLHALEKSLSNAGKGLE